MPPITQYATEEDLITWGISDRALQGIEPAMITAALDAASRTVDGYIASQYTLPLTAIGTDLKMHTAWLAAYNLMTSVGYKPSGNDEILEERQGKAIKWLEGVGAGRVQPAGMAGSAGPTIGGQAAAARPMIVSATPRGFTGRDPDHPGGSFTGD